LVAEVVLAVRLGVGVSTRAAPNFDRVVNKGGNVRALAKVLFNGFFFPFEVTSVLLIVAAVAAMVMTRRSVRPPLLSDRRRTEAQVEEPEVVA
jgi:NADH-quinone oxidoreductase subunit J